jgi:hypothetical protein
VIRSQVEDIACKSSLVLGDVDGVTDIGQKSLDRSEDEICETALPSHPIVGIGGVEKGSLDQVKKSGDSSEGSGLRTVGVNDVGLEFLDERMEMDPGTKVTQLGGMGDTKVTDRPASRNNPLH